MNQMNNQTTVESRHEKTMLLVLTAMMTAMVMVATTFFKVPNAFGYVHLGDGFVLLAAIILPKKYACFAGGVGAGLADLYGGYVLWAPWTFFIKMIMVVCVQILFSVVIKQIKNEKKVAKIAGLPVLELVAYAIAAIWTAAAYYVAQGFIYGNWVAALGEIPGNIMQAITGAVIAVLISAALSKSSLGIRFYYKRSAK